MPPSGRLAGEDVVGGAHSAAGAAAWCGRPKPCVVQSGLEPVSMRGITGLYGIRRWLIVPVPIRSVEQEVEAELEGLHVPVGAEGVAGEEFCGRRHGIGPASNAQIVVFELHGPGVAVFSE